MSGQMAEGSNPNLVQWIGDVRDIDKHSFLALLYRDEEAFKNGYHEGSVEIPRHEVAEEIWSTIQECVVFRCDVELDATTPTDDEPDIKRVHGLTFDSEYSERMNGIALHSFHFLMDLIVADEALAKEAQD